MTLHEALTQIAADFNLPADDLVRFANEDPHTGWDYNEGGWPIGSVFTVEGQVLYALARALKPTTCIELGTWHGCSATHILEALERNGHGTLTCVDMRGGAGDLIPPTLRKRLRLQNDLIEHTMDSAQDAAYDFIFEDGAHGVQDVAHVWKQAERILKPGGMILSHDADHFLVGEDVRAGIAQSGLPARVYHPQPADCGLAIWRKPALTLQEVDAALFSESADVDWLDDPEPEDNLEVISYADLKARAKEQGIVVRGKMKRETLIEKLRNA